MVTTGTTYLDTVTLAVIGTESTFSLLPLGRYLSPLTTLISYLFRGSNRDSIFATSSEKFQVMPHSW